MLDAAKPYTDGSEINGRYQILRFSGASNEGRTYRAYDRQRQGDVTLVEIDPDLRDDGSLLARWKREAEASGLLRRPNILDLHEVVENGDRLLLVRQHVEGKTLAQLSAQSGPPRPSLEYANGFKRSPAKADCPPASPKPAPPAGLVNSLIAHGPFGEGGSVG